MTLSHSVKKTAMATPDVAPMPPIEAGSDQSMIWITSIANSFICGYRGDTMRRFLAAFADGSATRSREGLIERDTISRSRRDAGAPGFELKRMGRGLAPLAVAITFLVLTCMLNENAAFSKEIDVKPLQPAQQVQVSRPVQLSQQLQLARPVQLGQQLRLARLAQLTEHNKAFDATAEEPGEMTDSGDVAPQKEMTESGDLSPSTGHKHVTDLEDADQFQGAAQQESDTPLPAADEEDQNVRRFSRYLPPQMQNAIIQSRKNNRRAPMVVFRRWASERKPFLATFFFCLFFGLVGSAFFPNKVAVAQECCRKKFWRCLGKAILVSITLLTMVRILDLIAIAQPLCTVLLAILEMGIIAGLSVGVSLIGEGITRGKLTDLSYFKTRPRLATFTKILIGSLILALIVQIPGAGLLPRFGIRIALLVAILGTGGLLKTKFGTQPISAD